MTLQRLVDALLKVILPRGEAGDTIRADLDREADAVRSRRASWLAELWRFSEALRIATHLLVRSLMGIPRTLWLEALSDVRYALRSWANAPVPTAVAVAVAGLGIGASTATFSVVHAVLLRPLPYPNPDELVQISENVPDEAGTAFGRGFVDSPVSPQNYLDYAEASSFVDMAWLVPYNFDADGLGTIGGGTGSPRLVEVASVSPSYFSTLGVTMFMGRSFLTEEATNTNQWSNEGAGLVVLSHDLWEGLFAGDPAIIGKMVEFEGGPAEVIGVLPRGFEAPPLSERGRVIERDVDVYIPLNYQPFTFGRDRGVFSVIARMAAGISIVAAREELASVSLGLRETYPEIPTGMTAVAIPLQENLARDYGRPLGTLAAMVTLVLLVASTNLASLAFARGIARKEEMAVRTALGAGRYRLFRLLLVESLAIAITGGAVGVVLAHLGTDLLVSLVPVEVARGSTVGVDARVIAFAAAVTVFVGVAFGIQPALRGSSVQLTSLGGRTRAGGTPERRVVAARLIGVQVCLTVVLLAGAALMGKSYLRLRALDRGYNSRDVLRVDVNRGYVAWGNEIGWFDPQARRERWNAGVQIMDGIRALPGVRSVAAGDVNMARTNIRRIQIGTERNADGTPAKMIDAFVENVSPEYFATLEVPIVLGRGLAPWDQANDADKYWWTTDAPDCRIDAKADFRFYRDALRRRERCNGPEVVVSESFAALAWPGDDPIGKEVGLVDCCWTVGGVARDVHSRGVDAPAVGSSSVDTTPAITLYVPYTDIGPFLVRTDGRDPMAIAGAVRAVVSSVNREWAVTFTTLEEQVADSLARPRFYSVATGLFAVAALLMALAGIYGVVAQDVGRRVQEIGVRKALGARDRRIITMVILDGLRPVLWGLLVGIVVTIGLATTLEKLLYGMHALDLPLMLAAGVGVMCVSTAACWIPARRALRMAPNQALSEV